MATHVVVRGDTLSKIAATYGTTVATLLGLNPSIVDKNLIRVGDEIVLPATEPAGSGVFNVKDYGAEGDGTTDDTAAVQAAMDAAVAVSGEVDVPVADDYYLVTDLDLAAGAGGLTVRGHGPGSDIRSLTGSVFVLNGDNANIHMTDLYLVAYAAGKACFEFVDGAVLNQSRIERVRMHTYSDTGHVIKATGTLWGMYDTTWADCIYSGEGNSMSTSMIHLDSEDGGTLNQVTWTGGRVICGAGFTAPAIFIGSTDAAANWVFNNTFEKINVEVCAGGFIEADGVSSLVLRDIGIYDTVATNVDLIVIGKTGGATLNSRYVLLDNVWRFGSSHAAGSYDLNTEDGDYTTVVNRGGVPSSNGAIKAGTGTLIVGDSAWGTIDGTLTSTTQIGPGLDMNDQTISNAKNIHGVSGLYAFGGLGRRVLLDTLVTDIAGPNGVSGVRVSDASVTVAPRFIMSGWLDHDGPNVGFYGTVPIAKQTGVAATEAGIFAALVALGLISA